MKTCRAMRMSVQAHMNYAILKNFHDTMRVSLTYMDFKNILRNNGQTRELFSESCLPSRYVFGRRI